MRVIEYPRVIKRTLTTVAGGSVTDSSVSVDGDIKKIYVTATTSGAVVCVSGSDTNEQFLHKVHNGDATYYPRTQSHGVDGAVSTGSLVMLMSDNVNITVVSGGNVKTVEVDFYVR